MDLPGLVCHDPGTILGEQMTMEISVNGEQHKIEKDMSLMDLLHALALTEGRIAVEVNGEIVPRSQFATQQINHQDKIEIVQAIGGG